jgi:hypothetical protein
MRVLRKMAGHPVEQHADPVLVTAVDERHQLFRLAET